MGPLMTGETKLGVGKLPIPYFAVALGLIGLLFAAIGGWYYTGLNNRLGEWQFANFGLYLNVTTILLFVALIALVWRIGRALANIKNSDEDKVDVSRKNLVYMTLSHIVVNWLSVALLFAAVITFVYIALLPSSDKSAREITLLQAVNGAEGPVKLRGVTAIGPSARFRQGFLFWQRTYFFMPVAGKRRANGPSEATVFIEVPAKLAQSKSAVSINGILRRDALPDEVATMYRNARIPVAQSASLVFANEKSSNWPARVLMYDLLLLAFLSFAFGLILRRRRRQLEKDIAQG
jgi:hypothetical protein